MKYIIALVWALILGNTLAYILASMAEDPFSFVQAISYTVIVFIAITIVDAVLGPVQQSTSK